MEKHIVSGGKAVYGASVGILRLDAEYPRIVGDIGNALTWDFPVHYKTIYGASPERVVRQKAEGLLTPFIEGAKELIALGADGIATTCGFLSLFQAEMAKALSVPVATSSLLQVPFIQSLLPPGQRVGIITISAKTLSPEHLAAVGVAGDTPMIGTDEAGQEFSRVILENEHRLDVLKAEADLLQAAQTLKARHPEVGAFLLECTNMAPYAHSIRHSLGLPVFDMYGFICWFQSALSPKPFLDHYR